MSVHEAAHKRRPDAPELHDRWDMPQTEPKLRGLFRPSDQPGLNGRRHLLLFENTRIRAVLPAEPERHVLQQPAHALSRVLLPCYRPVYLSSKDRLANERNRFLSTHPQQLKMFGRMCQRL